MNHTTSQNPYGYCPKCGAPGMFRERRPDGNDTCINKHTYPSKTAILHSVAPIGLDTLTKLLVDLDSITARLKQHLEELTAISNRKL